MLSPFANASAILGGPPEAAVPRLPADFIGLGYEMSSPARLGLLSPDNTRYVNLLRNLGGKGVLRCGGIVADYTTYLPDGPAATEPKRTVVTRAALEQLRAFLDRTGWSAMWSVNFGQGTLEEAIVEARDVAGVLGGRLLYLELGNEVENYGRGAHPLRKPPYDYGDFRAEYARWHQAIAAAVPGLRFAAPDTAESVEWLEKMATDAQGTVQLLTTHYYRSAQQHGSADQLSRPDVSLALKLTRLRAVTQRSGLPWRMCETNSFSGGGLPGVSDTLLGALWTLDFMLLLASRGCAGVNIETGVNQLGFVSSYSPIQDDGHGMNRAGAPYYGMLAFAQVARQGAQVSSLTLAGADPGFTAYTLRNGGVSIGAVLVNRQETAELTASKAELGLNRGRVMRLEGQAASSSEGLTLAGASVSSSGLWSSLRTEDLDATLSVPPMSAVVVLGGL